MSNGTTVRSAMRSSGANRALRTLARAGFLGSGLIHLLLGYLAST
jgi:hypothetical protein